MKYILRLFSGLLLVALLTTVANAAGPLLLANVSGTVEIQEPLTADATRTRFSSLNNQRVFAEFNVSPNDYALVVNIIGSGVLQLMPRSTNAGLPTIEVLSLSDNTSVIDTKKGIGDLFSTISSTATDNLFEGLTGSVHGRITFRPPISLESFKKFTFSGVAKGTNEDGVDNTTALIKLKVVTTTTFTPGA
jgi:hypothetical protein